VSRAERLKLARTRLADGPFVFSAGKGDEVAALLADIRSAAEKADEPGTLTYRTTRSELNKDSFLVFEEYTLPSGIVDHGESEPRWPVSRTGKVWELIGWGCVGWRARSAGPDIPGARWGRPTGQPRGNLLQRVQIVAACPQSVQTIRLLERTSSWNVQPYCPN